MSTFVFQTLYIVIWFTLRNIDKMKKEFVHICVPNPIHWNMVHPKKQTLTEIELAYRRILWTSIKKKLWIEAIKTSTSVCLPQYFSALYFRKTDLETNETFLLSKLPCDFLYLTNLQEEQMWVGMARNLDLLHGLMH